MIKSLVVAAALSIGLAGYAFAQNTITGAPAGTAPETPAPGTPLPIPGVAPRRGRIQARCGTGQTRAGKGPGLQPTTCTTCGTIRRRSLRPKFPAAQASNASRIRPSSSAARRQACAGEAHRPHGGAIQRRKRQFRKAARGRRKARPRRAPPPPSSLSSRTPPSIRSRAPWATRCRGLRPRAAPRNSWKSSLRSAKHEVVFKRKSSYAVYCER